MTGGGHIPVSPSAPVFPAPLGGELLLGVLGTEVGVGDLHEVRPVGQPVERGRGKQGFAEELWPLRPVAIACQDDRGFFILLVDDAVKILGPRRAQRL